MAAIWPLVAPMSICVCKTSVMLLQHFVVALLGAETVGSCGVMVLVAGHVGLVCNWPLGCPGIFWLHSWPC